MLPKTFPRPLTGAPRKDCIGGWLGGKPTWRGSSAMTRSRKGLASLIRTPRIPSPTGRGPSPCRSSGVMPVVMKSRSRPSAPTPPRAPYRASVSLTASSMIRCSTTSSDRSDARTSADSSSWSFRSLLVIRGSALARPDGSLRDRHFQANAGVDDDRAVLANHDRIAIELGDFFVALHHGADPQHQLLQGGDVRFGSAAVAVQEWEGLERT